MSSKTMLSVVLLILLGLTLAACGSIAAPRDPQPDTPAPSGDFPQAADAAGDDGDVVAEAPTDPPTPTAEPTEPPTATPTEIPPTATPTDIPPTATPTEIPTEASADPAEIGDAARGEQLFMSGVDASPGCITCHYVDQDTVLIGPSMIGMATRAGERVEGQSAVEYLRESILVPNAHLVENTESNVFSAAGISLMFQQYGDYLGEQDVNDLIAYMLTLE